MVLWRPTRPSRTNTKNTCPLHYRRLECKSRKSRDTPGVTDKFGLGVQNRAKANRVLPRECTGHSKHPLPTTQEMTLYMDITRWPTLNRLIIFFSAKDGKALYTQQKWDLPKKKKCKIKKWLSEEALTISVKRREAKSKAEKKRYTHLNAQFQRTTRRDKKVFLSDQCKETEENNKMGKISDLFKKIRNTKGIFHANGLNKGQRWYGLNRSRRY